jgi:hypothetical protein
MLRMLSFAAALAMTGGVAFAAERAPAPPCMPLAKFKATNSDSQTHLTDLTPGQFHFVAGIYVGSPTTPEGLPPGDSVILARHDGVKNGALVWVNTKLKLACAPTTIDEKLLKLVDAIKTGALDADGNEL